MFVKIFPMETNVGFPTSLKSQKVFFNSLSLCEEKAISVFSKEICINKYANSACAVNESAHTNAKINFLRS